MESPAKFSIKNRILVRNISKYLINILFLFAYISSKIIFLNRIFSIRLIKIIFEDLKVFADLKL